MELDDLKKAWNEQQTPPQDDGREQIRQIIRRSHSGLSKMLRWELGFGIGGLVVLLSAILFNRNNLGSFYIKLGVPLFAFAVPVYYRLLRSSRILQTIDYSGDVRSTLTKFLAYYTNTLRLYKWGSYGTILISMVLILTDKSMEKLSWIGISIIAGFMVASMLLITPFINRFYGSKAKVIREYLDEKEN